MPEKQQIHPLTFSPPNAFDGLFVLKLIFIAGCTAPFHFFTAFSRLLASLFFYQAFTNKTGIYYCRYNEIKMLLPNANTQGIISHEDFQDNTLVCITKSPSSDKTNFVYHVFTREEAITLSKKKFQHPMTSNALVFEKSLSINDKILSFTSLQESVLRIKLGAKIAWMIAAAYLFYAFYDYYHASKLPDGTRLPPIVSLDELNTTCGLTEPKELKNWCYHLLQTVSHGKTNLHFASSAILILENFFTKIGQFHFNQKIIQENQHVCSKLILLDPAHCSLDNTMQLKNHVKDFIDEFTKPLHASIRKHYSSEASDIIFSPIKAASALNKAYSRQTSDTLKRKAFYGMFPCCTKESTISKKEQLRILGECYGEPLNSKELFNAMRILTQRH